VCAAISFHSLEDRIVKRLFHGIDIDTKANMSITDRYRNSTVTHEGSDIKHSITTSSKWVPLFDRKALIADETEIKVNPRSRSAKLRAAIKL